MRNYMLLAALAGSLSLLGAATPRTPESAIADAAMRRDTARVRLLLKQGADVNAAQGDGMTALHWAANLGDGALATMLVFAGARLEATTRNGNYTPLHLAARAGRVATVKALLDGGANANAATMSGGATPLHLAAANGNPEVVSALLTHRALVDARDGAWEQTPLMWAAAANRVQVVEVLLKAGASVKAMSKVEDTPARERSDRTSLQLRSRRVAALKAAEQPLRPAAAVASTPGAAVATGPGASARADSAARPLGALPAGNAARPDATPRQTATTVGAPSARPDSAARAVAAMTRAPTPARDSAARVAAATTGRARPDSAAVAAGATDPKSIADRAAEQDSARIRDAQGRALGYTDLVGNRGGLTPLLFATRDGNVEAALALLGAGADINQVSGGDQTSPLLMATINGHFDLAKVLVARGANPKLASHAGATPLYATINVQWAAKSLYPQPTAQTQQKTTHLELMEALIKAGADVNARLTKHLWFMSYNFDLLGVNTQGATPFWRAAYGLDIPAMKLLLASGADPSVPTTKPAGRFRNEDAPADDEGGNSKGDPSGLPPVAVGGPGVYAIHAASGVGYGEGFAANSHRHAPEAWMASMKFLIEDLKMDVNQRDLNGFTALHHAAARGDNELITYLMSRGADIGAVSRRGQTVADMANGPVQRIPPFVETVKLLEKLGSKNSNKCRSC